ncbi:MAG: phosphotransferase family protein [Stackebrandtia sp.]
MSASIIIAAIPHRDREAVLVTADGRLPSVTVDSDDEIDVRLSALAKECGIDSPFLRRAACVKSDDHELILKEFDPLPADGRDWLPFDRLDELDFPEQLRPALERWVADQRGREYHHYRPAWSRPGWNARIGKWLNAILAERGIEPVEAPAVVQQWAISAVLRQATRDHGDYYLKAVFGGPGRGFWHEPALSAALAHEQPGLVPEVTTIDSRHGLIVMPDMRITEIDKRPPRQWLPGLPVLARIQRNWVGRRAELLALGCADRGPDSLLEQAVEAFDDERLSAAASPQQRERVDELMPTFRRLCAEAADWPVPLSLGHGDCHPGNVGLGADGGVRVFDWSDGAWTHPFFDVPLYVRNLTAELRDEAWDTYLDSWSDYAPLSELRELIPAVNILTALYQVVTYRGIVDNLAPDDRFVFTGYAADFWRRTLEILDANT